MGDCIHEPTFTVTKNAERDGYYDVKLSFSANYDMEEVDIISDGKCVEKIENPSRDFNYSATLPGKGYFRVRGFAKPADRKYSEGEFTPLFLLNPIFI
jgi:hypothetical protein